MKRHARGQTDSPGVGAIFYTQVALEVIPDDGSRDRLRASVRLSPSSVLSVGVEDTDSTGSSSQSTTSLSSPPS
jgi:hypothetical protein